MHVNETQMARHQHLQSRLAAALEMAAKNVGFGEVYSLCRDDVRVAEKELAEYEDSLAGLSLSAHRLTEPSCTGCSGICTCGEGIKI